MSEMEMPLAPRVFFSYASEDFSWVQQFKEKFTAQLGGVVVVEDFKDGGNLTFGSLEPWLDRRVDEATVIVAFVSRHYYGKDWTVAEWHRGLTKAQTGQLIFVPVMMDADAKMWWSRLRSKGELRALPPDYQYSNFATDAGKPANLDEGQTIALISNLAAELRRMLVSTPMADPGGKSEESYRGATVRVSGAAPEIEPGKQSITVADNSNLNAAAASDVYLLGNPVGRFEVGLETQVNAASDELQKFALSPKRWGDGWRNDAAKRLPLPSPIELPVFVQPLAAGEIDEPFAYASRTIERLATAGINRAKVALWLPRGQNDPIFESAAKSSPADAFPALRTDTPQGLAKWLCDLVRPSVSADTVIVQLETIGFPDDSRPDDFALQLADSLKQSFSGIVNREIRPNPGLYDFWGDQITEQIKALPSNRPIIAVHDLDITPSADRQAIRAALEVKLSLAQAAVEQVNTERAGARHLDPFFTALLVKHAKALPFASYPSNGRFKDWRLLHFDVAGVKPIPASLAVFRGQLYKWVVGCRPVGAPA